jgi:hypothetical protein
MRWKLTISLLLSLASAASFAGAYSPSVGWGLHQILLSISLPGVIGIFTALFLISAAVGLPHGAGSPILIGIISVAINAPLFWGVIQLASMGFNAIRKLLRRERRS